MIEGPIGLVGLGLVGKALAKRLTAAGCRLVGRDPDRQAGEAARALGVDVVDETASVAERCKVVFLSLPDSSVVDQVLWGRSGLSGSCASGTVVIDTTSRTVADIAAEIVERFRVTE